MRQADAARDAGQWEEAARLYEEAARAEPNTGPIWVQLGNALKETGDTARAEQAYLRARELRPDDMDVPLQLGHLYKIKNDSAAAVAHYKIALAGGLQDVHALHYLAQFGEDVVVAPAAADSALPVIYFDYSDLVAYFKNNRFPTGIQRVQIELFKASLSWTGAPPIRSCTYSEQAGFWVNLDPVGFSALCTLASKPGRVEGDDWQSALRSFTERLHVRPALSFPVGSVLINAGSSWWIPDYMSLIREGKAKYKLRYVPLIYDMIPLITPEHVAHGLTASFASWASSVFMHADAIGAISTCTSRDVTRLAAAVRPLDSEPIVMPLDADFGDRSARPSDAARDLVLDSFGLGRGHFVLFVGTFEARKNHLLVFQAWTRLIASEGTDSVPTLVCVGKEGWKFEQTRAYLEGHPDLADKVLLLSGISDLELYALYSDCLFTVYASFYEGWGLPVTESLCHGKVCLTADHSSLPEAGGHFAVYYDNDSIRSFTDQARRLIFDDAARGEREALIAAEYRPRSWTQVLSDFINQVTNRLACSPEVQPLAAPVDFGVDYQTRARNDLQQIDRTVAVAEMLRSGHAWYPLEEWGMWSRGRRATLAFKLPRGLGQAEDVLVYLRLSSGVEPLSVTIRIGAIRLGRFDLPVLKERLIQTTIPASVAWSASLSDQPLVLQIEVDRLTPLGLENSDDKREVGFGLSGVTFCLAADVTSRLSMIERAVMLVASPAGRG
jgi:glycosyltransferase involved in cell wall biosynthesis